MFDPIMGVGREAQVTADAQINPMGLVFDDVTNLLVPSLVTAGTGAGFAGNPLNVINPNYDYVNAESGNYSVLKVQTNTTIQTGYYDVIFDAGKTIYLRAITFMYWAFKAASSPNSRITMSISSDGVNFEDKYQLAYTSNGTFQDVYVNIEKVKTRVIRIRFEFTSNGSGIAYLHLKKLNVYLDTLQYR